MSRGARLVVAVAAAGRASGPVAAVLAGVATVPLGIFAATLALVGIDPAVAASALYVAIATPLGVVSHEVAHAAAYALLWRDDRDPAFAIEGRGSLIGAHLLRGSLAPDRDAAVALAGPAAGVAIGLPLLVIAPVPWLWLAPFLAHLVSLLRRYSDGAQVAAALRHERTAHAAGRPDLEELRPPRGAARGELHRGGR